MGSHISKGFWSYVKKTQSCWIWTGSRTGTSGYGKCSVGNGKEVSAHRRSWELENGEIPKGLWVLHHCDNKICVNPSHLFLGTRSDNMKDAVKKGRVNLNNLTHESHRSDLLTRDSRG